MKAKRTERIVHVFADGSVRDSVEGVKVPVTAQTRIAYEVVRKCAAARQCDEGRAG